MSRVGVVDIPVILFTVNPLLALAVWYRRFQGCPAGGRCSVSPHRVDIYASMPYKSMFIYFINVIRRQGRRQEGPREGL